MALAAINLRTKYHAIILISKEIFFSQNKCTNPLHPFSKKNKWKQSPRWIGESFHYSLQPQIGREDDHRENNVGTRETQHGEQLFPHRNKKDNGTWDMKQEDTFENPSCNKECWNLALFFMSMFKRQQGFTLQYLSQTRHPSYQSPFRIRMLYHDIWQEEDPSLPCTTMHRCPFEIL